LKEVEEVEEEEGWKEGFQLLRLVEGIVFI